MSSYRQQNRDRLIKLLANIPAKDSPDGWQCLGRIAIGGLREVGFSRSAEYLLVVSSTGRGVIDCDSGEKVARDYDEFGAWYVPAALTCEGIGPIEGEQVLTAGMSGGGLRTQSSRGEMLEICSPEWPYTDLYFCPKGKIVLADGFQDGCVQIASDVFLAHGFSWSGNTFVFATSSDVTIFKRC